MAVFLLAGRSAHRSFGSNSSWWLSADNFGSECDRKEDCPLRAKPPGSVWHIVPKLGWTSACLRQLTVVMSTVLTRDASNRRHLILRCEACSRKYLNYAKKNRCISSDHIDDWSCNFYFLLLCFIQPLGPVHGLVKASGFAKARSWQIVVNGCLEERLMIL